MKISFIVPTWHYLNDPFKLQPYWELYYGNIIKKNLKSSDLKIYDLRGKSRDNNFENVLSEIKKEDFYLYWIMKSGDAIEIYSIVDFLKKNIPILNMWLVELTLICCQMKHQKFLIA